MAKLKAAIREGLFHAAARAWQKPQHWASKQWMVENLARREI
jgi:hypothetical protein